MHKTYWTNNILSIKKVTIIITSDQSNVTKGRITGTRGWSVVFNRWRQQRAPTSNMFSWATQIHKPNGISIGSAIFGQLTAVSLGTSPSKLPVRTGRSGSHLAHGSLGPPELTPQTASWLVQPFLHSLPPSVPILYNGSPLPPFKIALPMADLDPI